MTSSSILTIFPSTNSTFGKYSADSVLMDFFPMQTNASSMSLPVNTSDICCHLKALPWPHTKSRSSKIGQHHKNSKIFNLSWALPTSTIISVTDIPKSQFHLCILPARAPPGISPMSAIPSLKHLKRITPQLWSLPIGSQTLKSQSRLTPLTMHLPLSFQLRLPMETCTPLHSTPGPFCPRTHYNVHDKELLAIFEAFK